MAIVTGESGGIAGYVGYSSVNGYIYNSYSIGTTSIYGRKDNGTVTNCYTTEANTRLAELNAGIDNVGDEESTEEPWIIVEGVNNGYPILKWQVNN